MSSSVSFTEHLLQPWPCFPRVLGVEGYSKHSGDRISKTTILRFLFKSVFCQAGNCHIKESWECSCVTKLMVSCKNYHCAACLGFSWKRQQLALPNQWELGSPLAWKVPVQLRCLLFGIQAWSSTHNKWHMCDRIPTLCLETALAFQPVTQSLRRVSRRRWNMCLVHRGHKP